MSSSAREPRSVRVETVERSEALEASVQDQSGLGGRGFLSRAWVICLVAGVLSLVVDLGTKSLAFQMVADQPVRVELEHVIARKSTGVPLNYRGAVNPGHLVQRGMPAEQVISLEPEALAEIIPQHEAITIVPNVLAFELVLNPGMVFGSAAGGRWWFVGFTLIACGVILWVMKYKIPANAWLTPMALGAIAGSGLGNLYDRVLFACVRDFIHPLPGVRMPFGLPGLTPEREVWPYVSNVADALLIVGVGVVIVRLWFAGESAAEEAPTKEEVQGAG